jgi:hypothetical protein
MNPIKKISNSFGKLPIFQKIAITYGGLFSISLTLVSLTILTSTSIFSSNITKSQLENIAYTIENYIIDGNTLTSEYLATLKVDFNFNLVLL